MEIWVLGTFEVSCDDRPVDVRGALPRRLLALLALTPGEEVSNDRLIEGLWGEDAPPGAPATLQSHVARLRRDLPEPQVVRTGRRGYLLDLPAEDVDAMVFERLVEEGGRALVAGRAEQAGAVLGEALQLWRGVPYAEFVGCPALEAEADRLESLRLDALERRISSELAHRGAAPPIAELEALVRWHPLRESFWALLMAAQYRAGRQADALASYQRVRKTLAEELGVDPGPQLQELERLILAQDPSLDQPTISTFLPPPHDQRSYTEHVDLVERDHLLSELGDIQDDVLAGAGRLVFVHGEAGAGKSALVRRWADVAGQRSTVLWGACDPLSSPRPLGPLMDVAGSLDPRVGEMLRSGDRDGLFDVFRDAVAALGATVLVVEDLQWADMSTLDLMRYLARRLDGTSMMVVATYRDDHLEPSDPLRVMLGDVASQPVVRRLDVPLLSEAAVAQLAQPFAVDPSELYRETDGNAFFVTEVLAAGGAHLPRTVQDAVLARVHRLSPQARLALESAAVIGSRAEPGLLLGMPDVTADAVDECVTTGMLRYDAPAYLFRHELVRQAVLTGVMPGRLGALHWQALDRLRALPMSPRPLARLAEHADLAGDGPAVLEFAIAAGDSAASLGSHREAAFQYGRAMPHLSLLDRDEQISLLRKRGSECYLMDEQAAAEDAWERLIALLREEDRPHELADALWRYCRTMSSTGKEAKMPALLDEAFAAVGDLRPSPELAVVLAVRAQNASVYDRENGIADAERALEMARSLGDPHVLAYCMNSCAVTLANSEPDRAEGLLRESLAVARANDLEDDTVRAFSNLAWFHEVGRRLDEALVVNNEALQFFADHDRVGDYLCLSAGRIRMLYRLGRWEEAARDAHELLDVRRTSKASRLEALCSMALIAASRGDYAEAHRLTTEADIYLEGVTLLSFEAFLAEALGEIALLTHHEEAVEDLVRPAFAEAQQQGDEEALSMLGLLLWRVGRLTEVPEPVFAAARLSFEGRAREAADEWLRVDHPYQAAWALLDSDDEVDLREARARFEQLGATVLVQRTDDKLRSIGAKVPRGARPSTRANPGGLTDRELEVLALLDEGLRNAEIAQRLYLSEKTVGHHVSAILAKLGASSRLEAVRRARELAATG